jgi:hypothetical protein
VSLSKSIELAAMLVERRDQVRSLLGERYAERVSEAETHLRIAMAREGWRAVKAANEITRFLAAEGGVDSVSLNLYFAAAVEITEKDPRRAGSEVGNG